jgi:hypothetical protein
MTVSFGCHRWDGSDQNTGGSQMKQMSQNGFGPLNLGDHYPLLPPAMGSEEWYSLTYGSGASTV